MIPGDDLGKRLVFPLLDQDVYAVFPEPDQGDG